MQNIHYVHYKLYKKGFILLTSANRPFMFPPVSNLGTSGSIFCQRNLYKFKLNFLIGPWTCPVLWRDESNKLHRAKGRRRQIRTCMRQCTLPEAIIESILWQPAMIGLLLIIYQRVILVLYKYKGIREEHNWSVLKLLLVH